MPSPVRPPLPAPPAPHSFPDSPLTGPSPASPVRRLVVARKSLHDREHERHERLTLARAAKRARQKRQIRAVAGAACAVCAFALGVRTLFFGPVWPRGRALSMGLSVAQPPVSVGSDWFFPATNGTLWRVRDGQTKAVWTGAFPSSPLVVPLGRDLLIAGGDGALVRLGAGGQKRWSGSSGTGSTTRPVFTQNRIVGADDSGRLWARNPQNGSIEWRIAAGASVGDGLAATPWGIVAPLLSGGTGRGGLRCVSAQTGKTLWTFPANLNARAAGTATPRFDVPSGRVFWCNDTGAVVALDARTGRKIWKSFAASRGGGSANSVLLRAAPVLAGGALIVGGGDGGLRAFDARDGHLLWTRWLGQPLATPLQKARLDGHVVVVAGQSPAVVVDAHDGSLVQRLGEGTVAWNGEFAAADANGVWRFWR